MSEVCPSGGIPTHYTRWPTLPVGGITHVLLNSIVESYARQIELTQVIVMTLLKDHNITPKVPLALKRLTIQSIH